MWSPDFIRIKNTQKNWSKQYDFSSTCGATQICIQHGHPTRLDCMCKPGWHGPSCTEDVDECVTHPCGMNFRCINTSGSYRCSNISEEISFCRCMFTNDNNLKVGHSHAMISFVKYPKMDASIITSKCDYKLTCKIKAFKLISNLNQKVKIVRL